MKVLQFVPSLNAYDGGTATYMQQLTSSLGKLCELHVCALTPVKDFVPLERCTPHNIPLSLMHVGQMKRAWLRLLEDIQPDIVHVNCCWMPQIALVIKWTDQWRKELQRPMGIVLTPHGMLEPWLIQRNYWTKKFPAICLYQRKAVKRCDLVVATADEEKQHLSELGWNQRIAMVQNGIDVRQIVMKSEWKAPRKLLFMSRVHPKKGLELLFQALARFERCPFRLDIAGSGEESYIGKLKQLVKELGLEDVVTFLGPVYGTAKWELIRQADVVVLPTYSENYGLIVAEALASGTPVLTTTGTPWQSIEKESCGWWVNPTPEEIYSALVDVSNLGDTEMEKMGRRARLLAENDCAIDVKVGQLYQLYLSILVAE